MSPGSCCHLAASKEKAPPKRGFRLAGCTGLEGVHTPSRVAENAGVSRARDRRVAGIALSWPAGGSNGSKDPATTGFEAVLVSLSDTQSLAETRTYAVPYRAVRVWSKPSEDTMVANRLEAHRRPLGLLPRRRRPRRAMGGGARDPGGALPPRLARRGTCCRAPAKRADGRTRRRPRGGGAAARRARKPRRAAQGDQGGAEGAQAGTRRLVTMAEALSVPQLLELLAEATPAPWQAQREALGEGGFGIRNEYRDGQDRRCYDMIGVLRAAGDAAASPRCATRRPRSCGSWRSCGRGGTLRSARPRGSPASSPWRRPPR
jgi:hypothetical protein